MPTLETLIPILQIAVGPVILISGVGLLLLSMTNRLGRAIDRARILRDELQSETAADEHHIRAQLVILWQRANIIRLSIIFAATSVLLAAGLIITLFVVSLFNYELGWFLILLFIGCLLSLIVSLSLFIWDINQSLSALKLEIQDVCCLTGEAAQ
jgi:hypothetical protein